MLRGGARGTNSSSWRGATPTRPISAARCAGAWEHVADDLWAIRVRIVDLDAATIDVDVWPSPDGATTGVWRGPATPPRPEAPETIQGKLVETVIQSNFLDAPRKVWIYTPPGYDHAKTYPVVYMTDGAFRGQQARIVEPLILKGELPPLLLVEIWQGTDSKTDQRAAEYLSGFGDNMGRFLRHENFVLHEVMPYVEKNYGASTDPKDRVLTGFSAARRGRSPWASSIPTSSRPSSRNR
jgi:hypothetical protein